MHNIHTCTHTLEYYLHTCIRSNCFTDKEERQAGRQAQKMDGKRTETRFSSPETPGTTCMLPSPDSPVAVIASEATGKTISTFAPRERKIREKMKNEKCATPPAVAAAAAASEEHEERAMPRKAD